MLPPYLNVAVLETSEYNVYVKINVSHVAKLANLTLSKGEQKKFGSQLSSVLEYVNKLNEVDTKNIEPTSQVTGLENITREDKTTPSLSQDEVLKNAKSVRNGLFKVTAVLKQSS